MLPGVSALLDLTFSNQAQKEKIPKRPALSVPTEAVAADTGREIIISSILPALVFLNDMIYLPCALFRVTLLHAAAGEEQAVAAEVAVAGGTGEDELKGRGCHLEKYHPLLHCRRRVVVEFSESRRNHGNTQKI